MTQNSQAHRGDWGPLAPLPGAMPGGPGWWEVHAHRCRVLLCAAGACSRLQCGCDGSAHWCRQRGVGAAGCERSCPCQPGPATQVCPSPGHLTLSLPLCPQSVPCSASGSSSPRWVKTGSSLSSWGWSWHWSAGPWTSPSPPASKVSGHWGGPGAVARHGVAMSQGRAMPLATHDPPGWLCPQLRSGCMGAWTPTCCCSTWPGSPTQPCSSPSRLASHRSSPPRP